jgi:two-component system sensor histidine kinase RegB
MSAPASASLKESSVVAPHGSGADPVAAWQDALQGLRLLALYRLVTPLFQSVTLLLVDHLELAQPFLPIWLMLGVEVLVAVATVARLHYGPRVGARELQLQALLDITLLAVMLYLTGGSANPFAPLMVLPVMICAIALRPRQLWLMVVLTMVCFAVLREHHVPLSHPQGEGEIYELHEDGMVLSVLLTSVMLVYLSTQLIATLRRHAEDAARAKEAQIRSDAAAAIGALAAGSAHDLGSPLGTMSIVAAELRRHYPADPRLQSDLRLIEEQLQACKEVLCSMADAGDLRRAESLSGARLDEFIRATVQRVQALNPGASIVTRLEGSTPPPHIAVEETLRHTIANVVQNAARVSPQHVEVAASWTHDRLEIVVTDRGPGFTPEALQTLGKRIDRRQRSPYGLGVALLLGAETMQRLGGSLRLMNGADGGARVELNLPLQALSLELDPASP